MNSYLQSALGSHWLIRAIKIATISKITRLADQSRQRSCSKDSCQKSEEDVLVATKEG